MSEKKKFELHVPSVLGCEKVAMDFAASVAKAMNFPDDRVEDLKTAVAEACTNAIEHGNKMDASTKVGVTLTVVDGRLQVDVEDEGRGIGRAAVPNIDAKIAGEGDRRGWGIFLINSLMDEVTFESTPEGKNLVKMIIHLER
jgi:serine/threonine-protein kinase RsbW